MSKPDLEQRRFELFYSDGGHGGPYSGITAAILAAKRTIVGFRLTNMKIDIRPYSRKGVDGFGPPLCRVIRTTDGRPAVISLRERQ